MSRRGRALANAALTAVSIAVGLALAEGALRLFFPQPLVERYRTADAGGPLTRRDPELGWTLKPDVQGLAGGSAWETSLTTNAEGFRDGPHPATKAPGVFRVAVLGDSFVFGSGVPQDAILTRRLAARLGPGFEIVNLGVPGYGTDQELLTLKRWGRTLAPDLVLAGFFWNDVMENASAAMYGMPKPRFTLEGGRLVPHPPAGVSAPSALARTDAALLASSHLWSLLRNGLSSASRAARETEERPVSIDLSLRNPPASRDAEFALTFALLAALREESGRVGAPLLVFSAPPRFLVEDVTAARLLHTTCSPASAPTRRRGHDSSSPPASTGARPGTTPRRGSSSRPCAASRRSAAPDPRPRPHASRARLAPRRLVQDRLLVEPPLVVGVASLEQPEGLLLRERVDARHGTGRGRGRRPETGRRGGRRDGRRRRAAAGRLRRRGPAIDAPVVSEMIPHLSEFVMGSFQSLRSVRGRISNISLSEFG